MFIILPIIFIFHLCTFALFSLDIEEFATRLGIDLDKEPHFRYLVQEGLLAPLPPEWKPW